MMEDVLNFSPLEMSTNSFQRYKKGALLHFYINMTDNQRIASNFTPSLEDKLKIGLVQVNNSFAGQNYFPYSVGFLQAYAEKYGKNTEQFSFLSPIYKRTPVESAYDHLKEANAVFFSTYVWNFEISKEIAKTIKRERPETLIVFGGCHVPERETEAFLRQHPYIDIASTDEGERPFKAILENLPNREFMNVPRGEHAMKEYLNDVVFAGLDDRTRDMKVNAAIVQGLQTGKWGELPSVHYLDSNGKFVSFPISRKIEDLNEVPSPYLSGFMNPLVREGKERGEEWIALLETNRGCPFSCAFCDWGVGAKKRMADYSLDRVCAEIDWFSENKIKMVYCCDANFGIRGDRDLAIAKKFAENKAKYEFPISFSVQNTKNSNDDTYNIQKVLAESGLSRGVLLAFQSLNEDALEATKRKNIHLSTFHDLQRRFNKDKFETFSDIILGLPRETYDTFTSGVCTLIENGQHNRIQFNNLSLLPNAEFGDPNVQKKHGFDIVESRIVNMHGKLEEWTDAIYEKQKLVVGTKDMPREDWVRSRSFGYTTSLLHFDKLLQIPLVIAHYQYGIPFKEMLEEFNENPQTPILKEINTFFREKARDIQQGGFEYCHSKPWLNVFWYPDELMMIQLATEGKLDAFYNEVSSSFEQMLTRRGHTNTRPIQEAITMNKQLLRLPFAKEDATIELNYNIWDCYRGSLTDETNPLSEGKYKYLLDRTSETWDTWEEWCEKVVWYKNKKGAYLNNCAPYEEGFKNRKILRKDQVFWS